MSRDGVRAMVGALTRMRTFATTFATPITAPITGFHREASGELVGLLLLREPIKLAHCTCRRAVAFAVNRDGATRCLECDATYVLTRPARL